ncbi:LPS export ABC transporter permease LptF [Algiphilus sp.]|uniref:LPS export ABC transporter permease LptF n=1 Tax=Algiphilus sp. TaxID=1872431 RepID=UPI002A5FC431|nr:LPS export ABC transporter permease LptF [Pseudomonadota bacterium]
MGGSRILSRYFFRDAALAWLAVLSVLLLILLASRSVRFLSAAAEGNIPADIVLSVVLLSALRYLMIITPISLLLGVMLAMGRMYKDQEITAATACGVSLGGIAFPFMLLSAVAAVLTGMLSLDLGPRAGRAVDQLTQQAREELSYAPFESGRFTRMSDGGAIFYARETQDGGTRFQDIFIHAELPEFQGIVQARAGSQQVEGEDNVRKIVLESGRAYQNRDGDLAWDVFDFGRLILRFVPPPLLFESSETDIASTARLLQRDDPEAIAELHWRMAAPIAVLLMVLIAVPLSHIGPRQGRYGKLVLGLLVYLVYANLLGAGQTALERGVVPAWAGLWWVHAGALVLGLWLWVRRARA